MTCVTKLMVAQYMSICQDVLNGRCCMLLDQAWIKCCSCHVASIAFKKPTLVVVYLLKPFNFPWIICLKKKNHSDQASVSLNFSWHFIIQFLSHHCLLMRSQYFATPSKKPHPKPMQDLLQSGPRFTKTLYGNTRNTILHREILNPRRDLSNQGWYRVLD